MILDLSTHYTCGEGEGEASKSHMPHLFPFSSNSEEPYQFFDHTGMGEDPNYASTDSAEGYESAPLSPATRYPRHPQQPMSPPRTDDDDYWVVTDTLVDATLRVRHPITPYSADIIPRKSDHKRLSCLLIRIMRNFVPIELKAKMIPSIENRMMMI